MKRSWSRYDWLPNAVTLTLIAVTTTSAGIVVEAEGPSFGCCPSYGRRSDVRHSRYWRSLKDLAAQGRAVVLRVHVTRWRCQNGCCAAAIFADRLVGVSAARVHHTSRCGSVIHLVGHAFQLHRRPPPQRLPSSLVIEGDSASTFGYWSCFSRRVTSMNANDRSLLIRSFFHLISAGPTP